MRCLRGRLLPAAADGPPRGSPVGGGTGKTLTAEDSVLEAIFSSGESTGAQLGQTMTKTPPTRRQGRILRFIMMTVLISFLGGRVAPVQASQRWWKSFPLRGATDTTERTPPTSRRTAACAGR